MVAFRCGPTVLREIDAKRSAERKYGTKRTARTSENIDAIEELVLSQEDAPASEVHRTKRHFEHKNEIIVNLLTFAYRY